VDREIKNERRKKTQEKRAIKIKPLELFCSSIKVQSFAVFPIP